MKTKGLGRYLVLIVNISEHIKKEELIFLAEEMNFLFFMGFDAFFYHSI